MEGDRDVSRRKSEEVMSEMKVKCQTYEQVCHMLHQVFMDITLSVGYVKDPR